MNRTTLMNKSEKKKEKKVYLCHCSKCKQTQCDRQTNIVGGNSVNSYSPFQSSAPTIYNLS